MKEEEVRLSAALGSPKASPKQEPKKQSIQARGEPISNSNSK